MRGAILLIPLLLMLAACSNFKEQHYFTSTSKNDARATNYFRLTITGSSNLSSARYVAGYYDERAVDLFFNELKTADSSSELFKSDLISPGSDEVIKPLDPDKRGAFVMILSTNSQAVANTIGNFAESNVVAEAITNLVNQKELRDLREEKSQFKVRQNRANSVVDRIEGLLAQLPADGNEAQSGEVYLRTLNVLAEALGADKNFRTLAEAQTWFQDFRAVAGG